MGEQIRVDDDVAPGPLTVPAPAPTALRRTHPASVRSVDGSGVRTPGSVQAPAVAQLDSCAARYRSTRRSGTSHMMATVVNRSSASQGPTKANAMPER